MIYLDEETIGEDYMVYSETQKRALPKGTPVINCHIQEGADLSAPDVQALRLHRQVNQHGAA